MRSLDVALFQYLTGYPSLERLIGTRLYPDVLPENVTYPSIAYLFETEDPEMTQGGPSLRRASYRFEVYGITMEEVDAIADQLEAAMYNYTEGSPPNLPYLAVTRHETSRGRDEETLAFWREVIFTIWYRPD